PGAPGEADPPADRAGDHLRHEGPAGPARGHPRDRRGRRGGERCGGRRAPRAAVGTVSAGAEVIDSRYKDFRFRAGDVVADNASSGAWATGSVVVKPEDIDLLDEQGEVYVDGAGGQRLGPPWPGHRGRPDRADRWHHRLRLRP